uniref:Helicase ATP-binding domain-containing protein n=1 Tax=Rhabditophanes sp. KR3021 TaxID=114890 RepID=A0AC35U0H2_9BILA
MKENGTTQATFAIDNFEETGIRVTVGEDITLSHSQTLLGDLWSEKGRLIQVPDHRSGDFVLEFTKLENMPQSSKIHYNVDFHWSPMSYVRMCSALKTMAHKFERTSPFIYKKLMGHCVSDLNLNVNFPRTFSVNGLPQLNQSQIYAVKRALVKPLSLIQGPPGTGKTITSASLVYHIVKQTKGKVLVCAPSNVAVDHLAEKLHQTGLKVIRFCAKSREDSQTSCQFLTLHSQLSQIMEKNESLSVKDLRKNIADAYLSKDKRIIKKIEETEMMLLKNADVICCTCITSGNDKLKSLNFEAVLIDECSQGTEPQIMVPIVKAKNQLILVGDHCQLGPVVKCIKADAAGLSQTLFERLMLNGNIPIRLQVQYRMHPAMSTFPSNVFYEGSLQNGVSSYDRTYDNLNHIWPVKDKPVLFWHVNGKEDISSNGTSYINRTEAINVEIMASTLINAGILPNQIGIITPYAGQSIYLARQMSSSGSLNSKVYEEIEIANVDGFQGREKDIIIFSCVRGNEYNGIGFLSDPRRLNVALTRARYGLVIIGNANILSQNVLWNHLIHHCKYQGYLMEGNISTLRPCNFNLPSEKSLLEFFRKHSRFVSTALTKTLPIKLQTIDLSKTYTTEIQNPNSLLHNQMYKQYVPFKSFLNHSQPTLNGIYPAELEDKKALRKRGKMKAEDRDDCESMHSQMSFTTPNLSQLPY